MIQPIDILMAQLGELCYLPDFIDHPGRTDVSSLGRTLVDFIMGDDPGVGVVPFGIITDGEPYGKISTIRGTQRPDGSLSEWEANFKAWMTTCTLCRTANWHAGWAQVYSTLRVTPGKRLAQYMLENGVKAVHGHSLGGPLATATAAEAGSDLLVVMASPKPGDLAYRAYVESRVPNRRGYSNPQDKIPKTPLTLPGVDFEHAVDTLSLDPNSVTPPVSNDAWEPHKLTNYRRMMQAA